MVGLISRKVAGSWIGLGIALMGAACGGRGLEPATRTAALGLRSTVVVPPATLSCHGDAFCREDVIRSPNAEAVEEVNGDCARRGGTTSTRPCSRERMIASCAVASGELGPITVFTYVQADAERERAAIATMSELCEQFDGTFELAKR